MKKLTIGMTCYEYFVILVLILCFHHHEINGKIYTDTIFMDTHFDPSNIVSDTRCNPSPSFQFSVSNSKSLVANFPYTPKGKIILGSGLKVASTYVFISSSNPVQHTTSVWINDEFVMNLPYPTFSFCNSPTFALTTFTQPITSYLDMRPSNTFTIRTQTVVPSVLLYVTNVRLTLGYVPFNVSVVDLVLSFNSSSIGFLSPSSYNLVKSEPFTGLFVNQLSDIAILPITVNNKAVDEAVNITITITSTNLNLFTQISLENIRKISANYSLNTYPEIQNTELLTNNISFTLYNVNLIYQENLEIDLVFNMGENSSNINSGTIHISVDASNDLVEEIYSTDNSKSISFSIYQTERVVTTSETAGSPQIRVKKQVSDLAYFVHQPQSPFSENCWFQVNLVAPSVFSGSLYIYSTRSMVQRKIDFETQDFMGLNLFLVIPSDQLNCTNSENTTEIYMRVEAVSAAVNFRLYLSRKFYSTLSDDSLSLNSIYTEKAQTGEAFGVLISTLTKLERVPLLTNLTFTNHDVLNLDKFSAFILQKSSNVELLSNTKAISVPKNAFPLVPLSSNHVLYFYERSCFSCNVNLTLSYPDTYSNPPTVSTGTISSTGVITYSFQQQTKSFAPDGVHWMFIDTSRVASNSVALSVVVSISGLTRIPPRLSLIATQDFIDDSMKQKITNSRSLKSSIVYNETLDCNETRNLNNPMISLLIPETSSGGVWKFGFSIDPSIQYTSIRFNYVARNYSNNLWGSSVRSFFSRPIGDFFYQLNFNIAFSSTPGSDLSFNFDKNFLQMYDRFYEIYVKIGQMPTMTDYDMKTPPLSFNNTLSSYPLRYSFSSSGTIAFHGSTFKLVSSEKLDQNRQKIYLYFREIPGSIFPNTYSCSIPSFTTSAYFTHTYTSNSMTKSDSSFVILSPSLYVNASDLPITRSSIGNYVNVQITSDFSMPVSETAHVVDWTSNEIIPMNKTYFAYSSGSDNRLRYFRTRLNARIKITEKLVEQKSNLFINILFPPSSVNSRHSSYVYVFVEEDVQIEPSSFPILITFGVMGGLFVLSIIYMFICIVAYYYVSSKDPSISETGEASTKSLGKESACVSLFLDLLLFAVPFVSGLIEGITKKKVNSIVSMIILGSVCLICSLAFYLGLLIPMGINKSNLYNSESEIVRNGSQSLVTANDKSFYACCRYKAHKSITDAITMEVEDQNLSCISSRSLILTSNLTINGVLYPSNLLPHPHVIGDSRAINAAKLQCPNSDIFFISSNFYSIQSMGISGIVLGTIFLFLSILYFTMPISDYFIKKIVNDKWSFEMPSIFKRSTTSGNNHSNIQSNSTLNSSNIQEDYSIEIVNTTNSQEDNLRREREAMERVDRERLRREREEMKRIDREERLRKEREARNQLLETSRNTTPPPPPEVKLPPPKPSQSLEMEEVRRNEEPTAPSLDNTLPVSNAFIYDNSSQGNVVDLSSEVYNPYETSEDSVVFYQRPDPNNPQNPPYNDNNFHY